MCVRVCWRLRLLRLVSECLCVGVCDLLKLAPILLTKRPHLQHTPLDLQRPSMEYGASNIPKTRSEIPVSSWSCCCISQITTCLARGKRRRGGTARAHASPVPRHALHERLPTPAKSVHVYCDTCFSVRPPNLYLGGKSVAMSFNREPPQK